MRRAWNGYKYFLRSSLLKIKALVHRRHVVLDIFNSYPEVLSIKLHSIAYAVMASLMNLVGLNG